MILYVESSAVLGLLLGEPSRSAVGDAINSAEIVAASVLTGIECARALERERALKRMTPRQLESTRAEFHDLERRMHSLELTPEVAQRARESFPVEPMRALDALHLATLLFVRDEARDVALLSLDERVRANAQALGIPVLP